MSEEQNIKQQPADHPPPSTKDGTSSLSEEDKNHADDVTQPSTLNTQPKTSENMEVHHHGHVHEQKKWKEYLFQFFMLFLAVFCGFLAEYQLEHYIEKERAEELAKTLYAELKSDSANLTTILNNRKDKEQHLQYVAHYFADSSLTELSPAFYPSLTWGLFISSYVLFEPNDGMLEQLKNSGSLRYFRNLNIQRAIGDFSVAISNLKTRNDREVHLLAIINRDFLLKHYDYSWINKLTNNGEKTTQPALKQYTTNNSFIPASLINPTNIDRASTVNYVNYNMLVVRATRTVQMEQYKNASNMLMKLLREEYRLQ